MKRIKIIIILFLFGFICATSCIKEKAIINTLKSNPIKGNVVSIIKIRFNELVKIPINNDTLRLSIKNIKDNVDVDCSLVDFKNPDDMLEVRQHIFLQINENTNLVELKSKPCGALSFNNKDTDIQEISDLINTFKSASERLNDNYSYYTQTFQIYFDDGAPILNGSYKIFIAKAFPRKYYTANLSDYKFILIITKN